VVGLPVDITCETCPCDTKNAARLLELIQEVRYTGALRVTLKPTIIVSYDHSAWPQQFGSLSIGLDAIILVICVDEHARRREEKLYTGARDINGRLA